MAVVIAEAEVLEAKGRGVPGKLKNASRVWAFLKKIRVIPYADHQEALMENWSTASYGFRKYIIEAYPELKLQEYEIWSIVVP